MFFMNSENFLEICRLCLMKGSTLRSVFDSFENSQNDDNIVDKISRCLNVEIKKEDEFSKKICNSCLIKIEEFYEFWNTTKLSQESLKRLAKYSKPDGNETVKEEEDLDKISQQIEIESTNHESNITNDLSDSTNREDVPHYSVHQQNNVSTEITSGVATSNGKSLPVNHQALLITKPIITQQPNIQPKVFLLIQKINNSNNNGSNPFGIINTNNLININNPNTTNDDKLINVNNNPNTSASKQININNPSNNANNLIIFNNPSSNIVSNITNPNKLININNPSSNVVSNITIPNKLNNINNPSSKTGKLGNIKNSTSNTNNPININKPIKKVNNSARNVRLKRRYANKCIITKEGFNYPPVYFNNDPAICEFCNKDCKIKSLLVVHRRKHTGERPFKCDVPGCKKSYPVKSNLTEHRKYGHTNERPFKCPLCIKAFKKLNELDAHVKTHGRKQYACNLCNFTSSYKAQLEKHKKRHTNDFTYVCDMCGKGFFLEASFKVHLTSKHKGEKSFLCTICKESFITPYRLQMHRNFVHRNIRGIPSTCTECGKTYKENRLLKIHKTRCHSGLKYECYLCGLKVSNKASLSVHLRRHSGDKPFKCRLCRKKFISKSVLKQHSVVHTGEKKYLCNICNKRYTQKSSLNSHKKKAHPNFINENTILRIAKQESEEEIYPVEIKEEIIICEQTTIKEEIETDLNETEQY